MILNYVETINVREISKKEKFLKLNMNSWIISFFECFFLICVVSIIWRSAIGGINNNVLHTRIF
ncbi:hypothetical protein Taitung233_05360 [Helicobacter pylori]